MIFTRNQSGFTLVEIAIVIVVVGIIAFLGYTFYNNQIQKSASDESSQSAVAEDVDSAPEINSTEDLDAAEEVLDGTDPSGNSSDSSQLDAELAEF